ncbi:lysosome membrane protein 2-like isoform X2 [Dysidea avara]|uniref:lysosome membrane protein 2-like isoform X2 n=1 Tax=Dysidea avara TaxID=196820 RepID=UPI0033197CC0
MHIFEMCCCYCSECCSACLKCCFKRRLRCWSACCVVSFFLTILFSLAVGLGLADEILFFFVEKELQLVPGSSTINDWVKSDIPQYETYYIFDTKNPDEFCVGDIPIVEEVGPFVYRKYDDKFNVTWKNDETLVTFHRDRYYVFDPDQSIGDPHDYHITVINVPLITILNKIEEVEQLLIKVLGEAIANVYLNMIDNQELFIERTAYEILWGYDEPLFGMLSLLGLGNSSQFAARSNHSDRYYNGITVAHTGKSDISDVAQLVQWNNLSNLSWNSEDARRVYGTLGFRNRPRLKKSHIITFFIDGYVRHVPLCYKHEVKLHGIELYHFTLTNNTFSNSSQYPPNEGYYAYNYSYGMVNLTSNYFLDSPIYSCYPHCLGCDPEYFKNVSGYHPDKLKHVSFADIEPFTGISMQGAKRAQLNVRIERNESIRQLAAVRDVTMYPWFYLSHE